MAGPLLQELRSLDSSSRALRSFGLVVGGALFLLSVWLFWRSGTLDWSGIGTFRPATVLGTIGLAAIVLALIRPQPLRPFYYAWMGIALVLGLVMTRVILTIVFVVLIVPIGVVMRLAGRDPLGLRRDGRTSYWMPRADMDRSPERLEKYY